MRKPITIPTYKDSDHPRARFTPEEVEEVRKGFDAEQTTYRAAAKRLGCSANTLYRMVNRQSYRED